MKKEDAGRAERAEPTYVKLIWVQILQYSGRYRIVQERDGWVDYVYLDFKNAFNCITPEITWKLGNKGGIKD